MLPPFVSLTVLAFLPLGRARGRGVGPCLVAPVRARGALGVVGRPDETRLMTSHERRSLRSRLFICTYAPCGLSARADKLTKSRKIKKINRAPLFFIIHVTISFAGLCELVPSVRKRPAGQEDVLAVHVVAALSPALYMPSLHAVHVVSSLVLVVSAPSVKYSPAGPRASRSMKHEWRLNRCFVYSSARTMHPPCGPSVRADKLTIQ